MFFSFFCGIILFIMNYRNFLINLISVEFLMLILFFMNYNYLLIIKYELIFSMVFLTFMVSEGVLGLCLLISMVRMFGNNFFQSFSIFKW